MENIPSYDLLQAIDPTKIKVPISERFAKLTLSSNKKQQQKCEDPDQEEALKLQHKKRVSVTRDISKQFDDEQIENKHKTQENPLLRSESSKGTEGNNSLEEYADAEDLTMDRLEVSDDGDDKSTEMDDAVELLSKQISTLAVESKSVSSSGSTGNISLFTEWMTSSESQRSSTSEVNNVRIVHNVPINVKEAIKKDVIPLNITSVTTDLEKTYEMTDDDEDEEEVEVITISDTSESHEAEQNVMGVSSLPSTSLTSENLSLPCLVDDKAERVAAFLRDVSIERHAMLEQGNVVYNDTIDQIIDNKEIDEIQKLLSKSRQIATADTESMTPDVDAEETPKCLIEREKRIKALEVIGKQKGNTPKHFENVCKLQEIDNSLHKFANDKTLDNTLITEADEYCTETTPKSSTNLKAPAKHFSASKSCDKDIYRIANDETQCNTVQSFISDESPKTSKNADNQIKTDFEHHRRLNSFENEAHNEILIEDHLSPNKVEITYPIRLVDEDTIINSIVSDTDQLCLTQKSAVYNQGQYHKTPEKHVKPMADVETRNNSSRSKPITEHNATNSDAEEDSIGSIQNSSSEFNATVSEHAITILETDEENIKEKSSPGIVNSNDNKLSNSFHNEDSSDESECDGKLSQIQMSMASINISAKINIKIHFPNNTSGESSEDDVNYEQEVHGSKESDKESSPLSDDVPINNDEQEKQSNNDRNVDLNVSKESISLSDVSTKNAEHEKGAGNEYNYDSNVSKEVSPLADVARKNDEQKTGTDNDPNVNSNEQSLESHTPKKTCNQLQLRTPIAKNTSPDPVQIVEEEKFLTDAEKLLTQLYGKAWQTPDVIRTLKQSCKSGDKTRNSKISSIKKTDVNNSTKKNSSNKTAVEESILDDFSIFRRNIVKTNLDSTRFDTPKSVMPNKKFSTETKIKKKSAQQGTINIKPIPQTELKLLNPPVAKVRLNNSRGNKGRWRQLIDDDSLSEGDNASDDEDADESWSKNASELEVENSDSDFEISPVIKNKKRNITTKRRGHSAKSAHLTKILNQSKDGEIVYLDLSKEEVEVQDEVPESPPANHDVTFAARLQNILKTCRNEDKSKLPSSNKRTKRKLFTPKFGDEDFEFEFPKYMDNANENSDKRNERIREDEILVDSGNRPFDSQGRPKVFSLVNKQLESVKIGKPIFQLSPSPKRKVPIQKDGANTKIANNITNDWTSRSKTNLDNNVQFKTPLSVKSKGAAKSLKELCKTPDYKYSFLKSLDVTVSRALCHPDALYYRDNYRTKKTDLSQILYDMYNEKLFENKLNVPIQWNKKLLNTAGRCLNKTKLKIRSSVVELSDKVLTSGDRLRCTLIHELCHAATWIFNGESGHGSAWKEWARRANAIFPEIPKIGVCHQYDIEYKYTYKCTLCGAKSNAHSKSKKVENIRCSYCHGAIEIFLNKKDKDGNVIPTPVKEATGFAKFVQENYKKFKRDDLKHADVMKLLSSEFASMKVTGN